MEGRFQTSDDEEDLEALRMAALQSLKKPSVGPPDLHFNGSPKNRYNRGGKFFRGGHHRGGSAGARNGQYNNWTRNTNLIAVPMVCVDNPCTESSSGKSSPKLVLPQDRYCKKTTGGTVEETKGETAVSKFDRYDNSDVETDEDSDEVCSQSPQTHNTEGVSEGGLKRSDSMEALVAALENEIQGGGGGAAPPKKEDKPKVPKKRKKSVIACERPEVVSEKVKENLKPEVDKVLEVKEEKPTVSRTDVGKVEQSRKPQMLKTRGEPRKWQKLPPLPSERRRFRDKPIQKGPREFRGEVPPQPPFAGPPPQMHPVGVVPFYNSLPPFAAPPYLPPQGPPLMFDGPPPLPPLVIPSYDPRPLNPVDPYTGPPPTMAPLSPRSAAFVFENRAIIEKRKRRSYSRSPSPRFLSRRSKSPPPKRRSLSPPPAKRRSPRPLSPRRDAPPKSSPPKRPTGVRDRLGTKVTPKNNGDSVVPEPEKTPISVVPVVDPILEARRRKFESNEVNLKKEGVIRLKPPDAKQMEPKPVEPKPVAVADTQQTKAHEVSTGAVGCEKAKLSSPDLLDEEIDEDALLDGGDDEIELDMTSDHLFSDEESDSDNEGRFKTKQLQNSASKDKIVVLPFTKLVPTSSSTSATATNTTSTSKEARTTSESSKRDRASDSGKMPTYSRSSRRNRSLLSQTRKSNERTSSSSSSSSSCVKKQTINFPVDSRKIEIKIRNPAKYEVPSSAGKEVVSEVKPTVRKVEVGRRPSPEKATIEPVAAENAKLESGSEAGDLRAQLSRKRAERQKHPVPDAAVPSRLLQTALQSVGCKNGKKRSKSKTDEPKDGKLPIHLRLGATGLDGVFGKKARKQKNKEASMEQV